MSKGFEVHPLTAPHKEVVINEVLIRSAISFKPSFTTEDDRIRVVGNQEKALREEKVRKEAAGISLDDVQTLLLSFRGIERLENLSSLRSLTTLHLDNNRIRRIENLESLVHLEWLDLSYNAIEVIDGLQTLQRLNCLSLYANKITVVNGLTCLPALNTLSLGRNPLENMDETVHYLHHLPRLQVLTLKECPLAALPHYRSRVLAFVRELKFLDGHLVRKDEAAKARDAFRENLLTVDEEDEARAAAAKVRAEQEAVASSYQQYNCPNEATLFDELLHLDPEGRNMEAILRSEAVFSVAKEPLDRHQTEFGEQLKQLTAAMKEIRERRDADDAAYRQAVAYTLRHSAADSQASMQRFEALVKRHIAKGVAQQRSGAVQPLPPHTTRSLHAALDELRKDLFEQESHQFDVLEVLHNNTIAKWKADAVEMVLQSSFEALLRLETDFQVAVRHIFDAVFEQRRKGDGAGRTFHYSSQDDAMLAFLDNKEEYQRTVNEWYELRRKRVEELEMLHLKAEETLTTTRTRSIVAAEQDRHRQRVNEVCEYVKEMSDTIDGCGG
ncbi:Leucine rich repeat/Leucine-rich repeat [Novymonas esmeraldas]|uniref:Dynein regulatory complex subunit 3 n=1 Tax=Novymonas esmeraldas TaxID=1808958 RepID=A0AAW0ENV2_9TRYP